MGIGGALMQDPRFREQMKGAFGSKRRDQQDMTARIKDFGLMGAFAGPPAQQQMNEALRVRRSEMSPSTARRMNRKGG